MEPCPLADRCQRARRQRPVQHAECAKLDLCSFRPVLAAEPAEIAVGSRRGEWRSSTASAWHDLAVISGPAAERLGDLARLRRVRDRIDRDYAQPLDVEALARGAHMSAGHFSREFRLAYGESPYGYLTTRRVERAMALLRRGDLSVTEVCFAVGYSSVSRPAATGVRRQMRRRGCCRAWQNR
jgi:AraC-like DNA-binding protein